MALATRCPHCGTTFRVAHDQLKLRAGLVRCGACKQIFNGVENLLGPDVTPVSKPAGAPVPPPPAAAPPGAPSPSASEPPKRPLTGSVPDSGMPAAAGTASPDSLRLSPPTTGFPASAPPLRSSDDIDKDVDPLTRMTLMDFTAFEEDGTPAVQPQRDAMSKAMTRATSDTEAPDEIEQAIEDLRNSPWRDEKARVAPEEITHPSEEEKDEPGFVRKARRQQRIGGTLKWVYGVGSLVLLLALTGQLAYAFRDQLAQRVPQSTPLLQQACAYLGCRIGLPAPIHALAIESSELQALPGQADIFLLRVLLRNHYDTAVSWPHLELTLNDANERPVARRSFAPDAYLPEAEPVQSGFGANSERTVTVHFALRGIEASGFRVYLFYP